MVGLAKRFFITPALLPILGVSRSLSSFHPLSIDPDSPLVGIPYARFRLYIIEPNIFNALCVKSTFFASDRTGVASDTLVEVHNHGYLCVFA